MSETLLLDGSWTLTGPRKIEIPAVVPGCVHADLRRADLIPDPYYRDNEKAVMWVGEADWTYSRAFEVGASLLERDRVTLRCYGLDTFAKVTINGQEVGSMDNMFREWEIDVKAALQVGTNTIVVQLYSTLPYARKMQEDRFLWHTGIGHHRISGGNWVRKEQSNYGWDWGPMIVTAGIWRSIEIQGFDTARIADVHVLQTHAKGGKSVALSVQVTAEQTRRTQLAALVSISKDGEEIETALVPVLRGKAQANLTVKKPALWWPNGLGAQPLYTVTATLLDFDGLSLDTATKRIGLRELKLVREADEWGQSFCFEANGHRFFAKGANWIPADQFDAWATDARCRQLLVDAAAANMNMIRVWGGGKYERDAFYDACDELGLCVWQDFMFGCSAYPAHDDSFLANVKVEAEQNVRRLRHHASLALWCGNNELEQIKPIIGDGHGQMSWADYKKLFDVLLAKVVKTYDPQTDYWPSSEHSPIGDRTDSTNPNHGDAHLWKVWHAREPFEWYRTSYHRFCSEFGFQSFPEPSTVATYTLPQERNVTSYVMEEHQRSPIGNSAIIDYMLSWFRLPVGNDSTLWLSQILQSLAIKYAVEHWRQNKPRCMGAVYWQLNDCWQVASWSSIDYLLKWKALHYAARRFFAPVMVSGVEDLQANTVRAHVCNDSLQPVKGELVWKSNSVTGEVLAEGSKSVKVAANASALVATIDLGKLVAAHGQRGLIVALRLEQGGSVVSENMVTFARPKHLELEDPKLNLKVRAASGGAFDVTVEASKPALWTWLELEGIDARFSDNFLHLMKGEKATVRVTPKAKLSVAAVKEALRARSLWDTYQ